MDEKNEKTIKFVLYILCLFVVIFFIVLLNKLSVAEGATIGAGDLILKNVGWLYVFRLLRECFYDK